MAKYHIKFKKKNINTTSNKWIIIITIWTFVIALVLNFISNILMEKMNILASFFILLVIVLFAIICDAIGTAVASAGEIPIHSMAASKVKGAKEAIIIIRNASAVANFFNDVIGDIASIISGAASAIIVIKIVENFTSFDKSWLDILIASILAAIMVSGKAIGKGFAIKNANFIVYKLGYVISFFSKEKI
ncbi:MAG TPA: hypothetical protein DEP72_06045 [Clostridiales bacterium]|nr:MAG: hypothetical protein A2Y18_01460 [Clostridiales bacterium GWD2_32_19]HCC07700.1 hypothetical protein [Clostridiales bacterium]